MQKQEPLFISVQKEDSLCNENYRGSQIRAKEYCSSYIQFSAPISNKSQKLRQSQKIAYSSLKAKEAKLLERKPS